MLDQFTEGDIAPPTLASIPNQLFPNIIDGLSRTRPEGIYAEIPRSWTSCEDGFRKVTYRQLANAINGAAWFLADKLGKDGENQALAYVGANDIGYIVYILGAVKAGHTILSVAPRNTKSDHASLFAAADCRTILTPAPPYSPTIQNILDGVEPRPNIIHVPTLFELLDGQHDHFPYAKTYAAAKNERLVMVHTSGTTNTPKLITYNHAFAAAYNRWTRQPPPDGYENVMEITRSRTAFSPFPFFHAGGLFVGLFEIIPSQNTMVNPPAGVAPSTAAVLDALQHISVDVLHLPAPFAEQISKSPDMLRRVPATVSCVTYGGGDVSEACATTWLARGVTVGGFIGQTETTSYPIIRPREGWAVADLKYIQPHPTTGIAFRPSGSDGLFEAVFERNADEAHVQPVFTIFPDLTEFHTKDLFAPHPTKPGLWLYSGRADDMIMSATTAKFNPVPLEHAVGRVPEVAAALMLGTGRYQNALLVEPADEERWLASAATQAEFLDHIWPAVAAANEHYQPIAHIARSHILLTEKGKPLRRAGKGTVQRAPSLAMYQARIDKLYAEAGDGLGNSAEQPYAVHVSTK